MMLQSGKYINDAFRRDRLLSLISSVLNEIKAKLYV